MSAEIDIAEAFAVLGIAADYALRLAPVALSGWALWYSVRTAQRTAAAEVTKRDQGAIVDRIKRIEEVLEADEARDMGAFEDLKLRLGRVEAQVEQVPSKEMVHRLEIGLTEVQGAIKGLTDGVKATTSAVTRIEDFLLRAKG